MADKFYIHRKNNIVRRECDWVKKHPDFEEMSASEAAELGLTKKAPASKPKPKAKAKAKKESEPAKDASTDDDIDGLIDGVDD